MHNADGTEWTVDKCRTMLFKFASNGSVDHLESLKDILVNEQKLGQNSLSHHSSTSVLGEVRDEKQRTLLHVAAKSGRIETIRYLVNAGLPVDALDHHGNTAALLFLKTCVKATRHRRKGKKKRSKRGSTDTWQNYTTCCEVLRMLLQGTSSLLTTPNNRGQRPTELLQTLWNDATEDERKQGDQILTSEMSTEPASASHSPPYQRIQDSSPYGRSGHDLLYDDEEYEGFAYEEPSYAWEDYFSGFSERPWKSHLDTIREEYEQRKRSSIPQHKATHKKIPVPGPSTEEQRTAFIRRHEAAISRKTSTQAPVTLEQFQKTWDQFTQATIPIASISEIPWPPFCAKIEGTNQHSSAELRIEAVLKFVGNSVQALRRLQVDWHPDRFSARIGSRLSAEWNEEVLKKVVAISQLLNTAMDTLRQKRT